MNGPGVRGRRWTYWLPALAVMALIFMLSSQSGLRVSADAEIDKPFRISGHLLAYALLAAMLLLGQTAGGRPHPRDAAVTLAIALIYAVSDEFHQSFVPDRTGRVDDLVVDAAGALVGLGVAFTVLTVLARRREAEGSRASSS